MYQFLFRRLILLLPVIFGITFVTFALARILPGDPCFAVLGEKATPEQCNAFREREGLNDPILVQFARYLGDIARGNFGESLKDSRSVTQIMLERLPMTLEVTLGAMLFSTIFGVLLGVISAVRRNTAVDVSTMIGANIGVSMPVFWLGLMLAYLFAILLKDTPFWIPPSGRLSSGLSIPPLAETYNLQNLSGLWGAIVTFASNTVTFNALITGNYEVLRDALWHLILPCVAVGTIPLSIIARMTRSSLLEVLGLDYIRTARAKGLRERVVVFKHAMRNAMLPIVTVIGLSVGGLMSGAVLTETVFALPGVGTQLVSAILSRDYAVVQAFTVVIALIFVFVNLIVDFSYVFLDPRVRLQ
ncbi:MAG: ABC transporter permease [Anaerolineae bacterium]|nr:ABC transporter permease [Anaerolineae bacterium]MCI0609542.1 ABC transporter permease [Anaerolineae bacterium]